MVLVIGHQCNKDLCCCGMESALQNECQVNLSKSKVILRPKSANSDQDSDIKAVEKPITESQSGLVSFRLHDLCG